MNTMECNGIMISSTGIECERKIDGSGLKSLPTVTFKLHGVPILNGKKVSIDDNEKIAEIMELLSYHKLRITFKEPIILKKGE